MLPFSIKYKMIYLTYSLAFAFALYCEHGKVNEKKKSEFHFSSLSLDGVKSAPWSDAQCLNSSINSWYINIIILRSFFFILSVNLKNSTTDEKLILCVCDFRLYNQSFFWCHHLYGNLLACLPACLLACYTNIQDKW